MLTIYDVMKWEWKGKRIVEIDTETGKMEDITDSINRIDQISTVDAIPIEWIENIIAEIGDDSPYRPAIEWLLLTYKMEKED